MKTANMTTLGGIALGVAAGFGVASAAKKIFVPLQQAANLYGQTVFITGGSRGLGLALAEEFARKGCRVAICARDPEELLNARQQLERLGTEVMAMACDVSQREEIEHVIQAARRHFGRIDILVNNAGIIAVGPLLSQTVEDFQEAMNVIFWGTVYPTLAALPQMLEEGRGRIVNVTSIGGKVSVPHLIPYGCAKFAMVGLSEGLHAELKKFGIHVLTVVPGLMRTGSHVHAFFKGQQKLEYGWFALSGANPLFSISVERAARQIVEATRRNQAELFISWQAKMLATLHGVAPGPTTAALALVNQLLPSADGGSSKKKSGRVSESAVTRSPLTMLSRRAARRYNQLNKIA